MSIIAQFKVQDHISQKATLDELTLIHHGVTSKTINLVAETRPTAHAVWHALSNITRSIPRDDFLRLCCDYETALRNMVGGAFCDDVTINAHISFVVPGYISQPMGGVKRPVSRDEFIRHITFYHYMNVWVDGVPLRDYLCKNPPIPAETAREIHPNDI